VIKVLVIEDNSADVALLRYGLDQTGEKYELTVLKDGEEALRFITLERVKPSDHPCVIVLDLQIPRHSGLEVLNALRQVPALENVGVIVYSSFAPPAQAEEIRTLGAHYRNKPVKLDEYQELAKLILEICREHLEAAV
jgi:CheY-like chemotaxis protein